MAKDLANSSLSLHTAKVCKPLVVQHLLLPAGPPHAGALVVQAYPLNLHLQNPTIRKVHGSLSRRGGFSTAVQGSQHTVLRLTAVWNLPAPEIATHCDAIDDQTIHAIQNKTITPYHCRQSLTKASCLCQRIYFSRIGVTEQQEL